MFSGKMAMLKVPQSVFLNSLCLEVVLGYVCIVFALLAKCLHSACIVLACDFGVWMFSGVFGL